MKNSESNAYPIYELNEYGLSKREYLIAKAMQGLCANPNLSDSSETWISTKAIEIADRTLLCIGG